MAQYPVLLPGTAVTLSNAGAPHATLVALVVVFIVAVLLIGPSFALLFSLQGRHLLGGGEHGALPAAVPAGNPGRAAAGRLRQQVPALRQAPARQQVPERRQAGRVIRTAAVGAVTLAAVIRRLRQQR